MNKMRLAIFIGVAALSFGAAVARADTLELKNGSVIKGTYAGGTATEISFRVGSTVQQYPVSDVALLKFEGHNAAPAGFASHPASSATVPANTVTVPTGTKLLVRTIDAVDSDKNHPGDKFMASLEEPLYVNDVMVAPKGASVYGRLDQVQEAGHLAGKSQLRLALTGIVIDTQTVPLTTGDYEVSGKSRGANTAKKVGGGAALGALIGAVAGGGKGAAVGATVGAGAGTAVQIMTKGEQVHVPSETLLEFALAQPVTVTLAQSMQPR